MPNMALQQMIRKKVRSGEFYEQCINKVKTVLENEPAEVDDDPFDL